MRLPATWRQTYRVGAVGRDPGRRLPVLELGPVAAVLGVLLALGVGIVLSVPVAIVDNPASGDDLSTAANVAGPARPGARLPARPVRDRARARRASRRRGVGALGLRRFRALGAATGWLAAIVVYLVFAVALRRDLSANPNRRTSPKSFGAVPVQILLIVDRRADQRGGLLPGDALRRPARADAVLAPRR